MNRIRGILNARAKSIYSEGVIAESFSELDVAEKRYREVLEVVPVDNDYFKKASSRLAKLTVLRRPASEGASK
jgi:predicted TPR repeat methyltransferase